jgi:hypothetical protein
MKKAEKQSVVEIKFYNTVIRITPTQWKEFKQLCKEHKVVLNLLQSLMLID